MKGKDSFGCMMNSHPAKSTPSPLSASNFPDALAQEQCSRGVWLIGIGTVTQYSMRLSHCVLLAQEKSKTSMFKGLGCTEYFLLYITASRKVIS